MKKREIKFLACEKLLGKMDRILENIIVDSARNHPRAVYLNTRALHRYATELQQRFPNATRLDLELINKLSS
jgi:hypothetical protein